MHTGYMNIPAIWIFYSELHGIQLSGVFWICRQDISVFALVWISWFSITTKLSFNISFAFLLCWIWTNDFKNTEIDVFSQLRKICSILQYGEECSIFRFLAELVISVFTKEIINYYVKRVVILLAYEILNIRLCH